MCNHTPPGRGVAGSALFARMAAILDPLTTAGQPIGVVKPQSRRAWSETFATEIPEPILTRCPRAIRDITPLGQGAVQPRLGPTPAQGVGPTPTRTVSRVSDLGAEMVIMNGTAHAPAPNTIPSPRSAAPPEQRPSPRREPRWACTVPILEAGRHRQI
jgi:hypothetical protein